ncbi:uncharacterized protein F4812DRAFT_415326 [Daldinia caldariorum]|uniref:uncharacterized protein n=1 Tax=Daldinia caldariorum TaxID=326644 RepID=UPI002007CC58|nr:uncharacterized protein F4812DRAFT_415326 [Daldinia caldariorum]KAI1471757.1 hypothetical protein F4812DRAFT_415326 [Daldinia caldariorum]
MWALQGPNYICSGYYEVVLFFIYSFIHLPPSIALSFTFSNKFHYSEASFCYFNSPLYPSLRFLLIIESVVFSSSFFCSLSSILSIPT